MLIHAFQSEILCIIKPCFFTNCCCLQQDIRTTRAVFHFLLSKHKWSQYYKLRSVLSVAMALCQLIPKTVLSVPKCSIWVIPKWFILFYLEISYKEINLLLKHSVTGRKVVFLLSCKQIFFFLIWLIFFHFWRLHVTDKLLTRSLVNFKVRFMICLQEHFSMLPWAKMYKFIID